MKDLKSTRRTISKSILITVLGVSLLAPSALAADTQTDRIPSQPNIVSTAALNPADAKISKDQAVEITRKLFPNLKDAMVQSVDFGNPNMYPPRDENIWTIQWQIKTANGGSGFNSTVDAMNGDLLSIYMPYNEDRNNAYYPPKVTKKEAEQLAKAFIAQAAPSISLDSLVSNETAPYIAQTSLFGPIQYNFNFQTKINNVIFVNSGIQVTMDGDGHVTQFYKSPLIGSFPPGEPKVTMEQAVNFAKEHRDTELQYIPVRKGGGKIESWWLGYMPHLQPIDAQTGHYVSLDTMPDTQGATYVPVPKKDKAFTPLTTKEELTGEQAAQIVEQAFPELKGKKLLQKFLNNGWRVDNQKVWSLNWGDEDQRAMGPYGSTRATVDAKTGVIMDYSINAFGPYPPASKPDSQKPAITKEAAKMKAEELINIVYPNASEDLQRMETMNNESQPTSYTFRFQRFYKGVLVSGEQANVTLDLQGNVMNYYGNKSELDEQAMDALKVNISKEQALDQIWENTKLELQYISIGGYPINNEYVQPIVKLVYNQSLKNSSLSFKMLDATDGTWKAAWSDLANPQAAVEPTDIAGHWAQKDLETMLQYQILTADNAGKLNPDQTITYGDWLTMMATAMSSQYKNYYSSNTDGVTLFADVKENSPQYDAVRLFVQMKWLTPDANKKLEADRALTRESLATSLVQIVKYKKLSNMLSSTLTMLPFTDSNQIVNKSDIALAVYLGLMQGTDGAFKPLDKVTKAEAASVIMRLVRLQGKLDQSIGQ